MQMLNMYLLDVFTIKTRQKIEDSHFFNLKKIYIYFEALELTKL